MKIFKTVVFVLFTTLFCSTGLHAQNSLLDIKDLTNTKIDNYSDEDLSSFYNKAVESGLSETQFYKMAAEKGLAESEITKLKNRLQYINGAKKLSSQPGAPEANKEQAHTYDTSNQKLPLEQFKNDSTIFGSELFTTNSLVFEPNLRIPAPAGYILGPDDEIVISVYGFSEKKYNVTVSELGEIYIPNVGPIYVNGLQYRAGKRKNKGETGFIYLSGQSKAAKQKCR